MASILRGFPESAGATVASTELNSLASTPAGATGAEYDNSASGERWTDGILQLNLEFVATPTAGGAVDVYLMTAPDGSTYPTVAAGGTPYELYSMRVGSVTVAANANDQVLQLPVRLPPFKLKFHFVNRAGSAMESSGNTVVLYPFTTEVAAS